MKSLKELIIESRKSSITLTEIKKIVDGVECEIDPTSDKGFNLKFEEDDYWDFEEDNLTSKLQKIFDEISKKTTVVRWDDRSWLIVKKEFIEQKPLDNEVKDIFGKDEHIRLSNDKMKDKDIHKIQKNGLTLSDEELIDLATSTGYRDTIENYIKIADTNKAKKILKDILNDPDMRWEK